MEILNNLWNVLITEDENLTKYVSLSLTFIEIYVTMKLFTTVLNISYTKKQRNIYVLLMSSLIIITNLFATNTINMFVGIILLPVIIKLTFKTSILKSILAEIIPMLIFLLLETIYLKICYMIFNITPNQCKNIIAYRIPYMLTIYLTNYLIAKAINSIKINFEIFENLHKRQKQTLIINLIFVLICIATHFYLLIFYNEHLPFYIVLISMLSLFTYSIISIYSIIKTLILEITKSDLEQSQLHNKTLEILYENTRAFKHDFSNIITALGGYIHKKDINGLEKYYNKIVDECHINNNLSTLNPTIINNPAVYNILATKYYKAYELDIKINLQIFINLNDLKMDIYNFSRILGILLDNAIEASANCNEKLIVIDIHDIKSQKCRVLTIENTYLNKDIDISKLFEKGYTSKENDKESHGIGLWQVSKILKKHNNVILDTRKNDQFFTQELVIYYK